MPASLRVAGDRLVLTGLPAMRCAIGRGGYTRSKQEGDGATPVGTWPVREGFYRADRIAPPETALPMRPIGRDDGWCDDPGDPRYNRPVTLPFAASHETLWREDHLYDLVIVLGYNDDPPVPGRGSAIFMHVARPDYGPTEGCVALAPPDLIAVVRCLDTDSRIEIAGAG